MAARTPRPTGVAERFRAVTRANVAGLPQWSLLPPELREAVEVVSSVLPFRTNEFVTRELIDWSRVPDDPLFQLTFPQRGMLADDDYATIARLLKAEAPRAEFDEAVLRIRRRLNPHPAGQKTHNVPMLDGRPVEGLQHKYRETVLFFPSQGQTCHAYCTYCFRWPQFVNLDDLKFAAREVEPLCAYLRAHPEVTDVLITGGDPLVMSTRALRTYITPLLAGEFEHVRSIRIGTKSVAYWPQRFVSDADADDLLDLFEEVVARGRNLALMGHYSHPRELQPEIARTAVRRIRSTGAVIRMQSPVVRHVNDDAAAWADLWRTGVQLGCVPYYMFVERDTGAKRYFELPLVRCWNIFREAFQQVSGLARTVRGPSMSVLPGKVHVLGVRDSGREAVFVLQYLQAREPELVGRPFFARFDPRATWFDQLTPFGAADREFMPALAPDAEPLFVPLGRPQHADFN